MVEGLKEILGQSELFSGLCRESLERVEQHFKRAVYEQDVDIFREGDSGDCMFVILSGKVVVLRNMGWGEREINRMFANEVFGEMALISDETRSATIRTLERTECLKLDHESFDLLLDQDLSFAQRIAKVMTKRLSALTRRTSDELISAHRALMFAIADLTDSRDPETGTHLERTRNYCVLLAEKLSRLPRYADLITHSFMEGLYHASPLHDVGKVAVPDAILQKPARLDPAEYEIMKSHTIAGATAFEKVLSQCDTELFRIAHSICLHHHEKWNGTGYPGKLAGEAIPLEARIMSFADVYDALLSKRVYKPAFTKEATRAEIRASAGTFFDPFMTEVMLENIGLFEAVYDKYKD